MSGRVEYHVGVSPPEPRRMTVDDLRIVFRQIELYGSLSTRVPPDGSPAFSAFGTPDYWEETQKVHEHRRPRTFTHTLGPNSIMTGHFSPGYVRRMDVFPAEVMTGEMLLAWQDRGVVRKVGTFEEGRFVPDKWFEDELNRYVWHHADKRFVEEVTDGQE